MSPVQFSNLAKAAYTFPAIDNHTHPLLKEAFRDSLPFEGIISEANGSALTEYATETLACYRATRHLSELFGCDNEWEAVKDARKRLSYSQLCKSCLEPTGIQCVLLDDGLDGNDHRCEDVAWHDQFTSSTSKRIVRIEVAAQDILRDLMGVLEGIDNMRARADDLLDTFIPEFSGFLFRNATDERVSGFKSIACYRTGLDISLNCTEDDLVAAIENVITQYAETGNLRLADKCFIDYLVRQTLQVAGLYHKPVQFHTGLGDNDISLPLSNPALMQPIIKAHPQTRFVLLHSSYPFTQEAGYLTSVYENVYLDFGEIFPFVSAEGQKAVFRQVLELCPTNKIMWSTDGHFWPETYYLGTVQAREVMYGVLSDFVLKGDISESQAVTIVERSLFHNANALYSLNLKPHVDNGLLIPANLPQVSHHSQVAADPLITRLRSATLEPMSTSSSSISTPNIRFVRVQWVDLTNTIRYRVLPYQQYQVLIRNLHNRPGITLTKSALGLVLGAIGPGFSATGEYLYTMSARSFRLCGYAEGHASVLGRFVEKEHAKRKGDGSGDKGKVGLCPRTLLSDVIRSAQRTCGVEFLVGFETEFTLLSSTSPPTAVNSHGWSVSSAISSGAKVATILDEIATSLEASGIELLTYHSEAAPGQYEVVTGPLPPMEAVDALITTRETIYNIASKHGYRATLAPQVFPNNAGSASHVHISLKSPSKSKASSNSPSPTSISSATPLKTGLLSRQEGSFLQGMLDHLPSICALSLPTPASYKRIVDGAWSGGTYVCWGRDNRECPIRLCGSSDDHGSGWNFEIKALDGTANPYLALAAILTAGTINIKRDIPLTMTDCQFVAAELDATTRLKMGITKTMPTSIMEAREALNCDNDLIAALGSEFVHKYLMVNEALEAALEASTPEANLTLLVETY